MIRSFIFAAGAAALLVSPSVAMSKSVPCRDTHGKFIPCPAAKPKPVVKCRNAKGHYARCGTPGTRPA